MPLYRLVARIGLALYARKLRRAGRADELAQRLALAPERQGSGPLIWVHAASNGEVTSARAMIEGLLAADPDLTILVTVNSQTARDLVESWAIPRLRAAFAPFDLPAALHAFLDRWQPLAMIVIEAELWPERMNLCARRGIPVFVLSARMSAGSYRLWRWLPFTMRRMLRSVRMLCAQDAASLDRFRALGLPDARLGPLVNLKATHAAPPLPAEHGLPWPRAETFLAASTHEGEEEAVLDAFEIARAERPGLRLILAPRHPRRRDEIEALLRERGLAFATRSRSMAIEPRTCVYLADTMGEMALWYSAAGVVFVGGSLVDRGGHTPFEPAAHDCAIVHGPHVSNSAPAYAALQAQNAAIEVTDARTLARALARLGSPAAQAEMGRKGREALAALADPSGLAAFRQELALATDRPLAP